MASSSPFLSLLIILILLTLPSAQPASNNISSGTVFSPPISFLSPAGDFAFGFRPLETDPSLFLLAIWYSNIPNKTIVWTANGDNPVRSGATATLTSTGQLDLKDENGQELWNTNTTNASHAALLDTGNLVLWTAQSVIKWQSFDHPTDTLLPTQVVQQGTEIYARLMDTDYSRGRFELTLQEDGNLVFYSVAYPTTHRYDAYLPSSTFGTGITLVFNESGSVCLSFANGTQTPVISTTIPTGGTYYLRATLDPDGVFRQYAFPKEELSTGSWAIKSAVTSDICSKVLTASGSGACGFNSYCTLDPSGIADCQCPPYYSFYDPMRKYRGCKPDFPPQICEPGGESAFEFIEMSNVNWPNSDAEILSPMNESQCRDNCLKDCFCSVAIYYAEGTTCYKKKSPLSNGNTGIRQDSQALIKISRLKTSIGSEGICSTDSTGGLKIWVIVGSMILGGSVVLNLVQLGSCLWTRKRQAPHMGSGATTGPALLSFSYKELQTATKDFSEELGRGGFGTVYKGILPSEPRTLIAVKKLESLLQEGEKDFANEVATIGQTHHKNLVRLLGFCKEDAHRLLVYEFMSNGSLNKCLFGSVQPNWNQRVQIALGIASGLAYLHEECRTQIIHCDIKPQNILLDENFDARISDFGLAKLLRIEQTRTNTGIRGTIGYFAPEWFKYVAITAKVDVYSFGVMLLEIITCRRNFDLKLAVEAAAESGDVATVSDWAKECYRNGRLDLLVAGDEEAKEDGMRLERFVLVALWCIQDEPWLRPSMKKVVQMLEGVTEVLVPPNIHSVHL